MVIISQAEMHVISAQCTSFVLVERVMSAPALISTCLPPRNTPPAPLKFNWEPDTSKPLDLLAFNCEWKMLG